MKIHAILIMVLICIKAGICEEYKPLSSRERHEFNQAYKSILEAYRYKDYLTVRRYCPGIIEKYGPIMLDSKCMDLRPKLDQLKQIALNSIKSYEKDSLSEKIENAYSEKNYAQCAITYQCLFNFYDGEGLDSLKKNKTPRLYECIEKMYQENPTFETFSKIDKMKYSDREYVEKIRGKLEAGFEEKILQLSSKMDIDSLHSFRNKYPGIYTNDINSLIEKVRDKYKLSVLRKISPSSVAAYYEKFGGPDEVIEEKLERVMYITFFRELTQETGEEYLYRFPRGKNAEYVKNHLPRLIYAPQDSLQSKKY